MKGQTKRAIAVAGSVIALAADPVWAQPPQVDVGGQSLSLSAQATRSRLFGLVDIYQVAVYTPRGDDSGRAALRDPAQAKALRVEILYDESLPDHIPSAWKDELMPVLGPAQQKALQRAYARLGPEDHVLIEYTPGRGTTVSVSGERIITDRDHQLVAAFLDVWMGQAPVSEEVKQSLLHDLR